MRRPLKPDFRHVKAWSRSLRVIHHGKGFSSIQSIANHQKPSRHRALVLVALALGTATWTYNSNALLLLPRVQADSGEPPDQWSLLPTFITQRNATEDRGALVSSKTTKFVEDADHSTPGQQAPPPQTKGHAGPKETEPPTTWQAWSNNLESMTKGIVNFEFSSIGDKITDAILPTWAKLLPGFLTKLQNELDMSPESVAYEIWQEAHDPEINPEILWDANVRVSNDLCIEEMDFLRKRKIRTTKALAKYMDVPEDEVHPDDVPVIAMCGSGGGLRALVAGASSYLSAQEAGLFDCVTYTAGVSGSCWLQTLYYSSLGRQSHQYLIQHLKHRLGIHIAFPSAALALLDSAPTNKYLLSGIIEKHKGLPDAEFGLVDVYGLLLAARLMVPKGDLGVNYYDLKVSNQRRYIDEGDHPLPIYTSVRHEIPIEAIGNNSTSDLREQARKEAWFQWFETTPYEFFCEELQAGIPTWAIGRTFDRGQTVWRENGLALPEMRIPIMMGIWGSAFCATLSHYYREVRPVLQGLAGFGGLDNMLKEKDEDLVKVHPIDPASMPNFARNMKDLLPSNCPESIHESLHLQLMDAGMSNNLPIYPLLRPGRDVDIIIAFDASADVMQDNWLKISDGYVRQRGIKGWPVGAGWPSDQTSKKIVQELDDAQATDPEDAQRRVEEAQKSQEDAQADGPQESQADVQQQVRTGQSSIPFTTPLTKEEQELTKSTGLGYCTVWVGTTEERQGDGEPPPSKQIEEDWELMSQDAGIAVVYFPFMANPAVPGVDPRTSEFMSTWNFVYTPEEIDKVVQLARTNFDAGKEQTRRTIKAVWQRKKSQRLEREKLEREARWSRALSKQPKIKAYGEHGDHFT